ncbi:DUF1275 domain-containing protein [Mycobacteroides abscessus]|uniref:Transmembrane protein n=5 Tax=Mycobacteroides abscessus TaxID=36809 RepID=B1ME14_MYCA9|nr:hypothetical protein MA3A0122S_3181 [Mycobacteroides abscessus 3A-0122-S]EIV49923.1 hypothetical protein MA3A0930S_3573 [Mycobacteroides abscessus 3A-0930-S]EUA79574.1 hypothetical protein I544_0864 [Mycobacteroides abscessus subsp. bolletii 103]OTQ96885.1 DUF1275 family protein [Mycobacteroides abscessus]RTZ52122.1 DUF1275 domain-containing protein [Mycobacteroides abscessus subsp. abscessus]CAM63483.1 Conserved hypothetical protein [Mycobacteroides abscessus ATCC 19977]
MWSIRRREMVLATGLSTVAGFLDAIGFVHLGGYFLSFMSGNTTRMAASTATLNWESAYKAAGLIGMFFIGVMIGAIASRVSGEHERIAVLAVASTTVAAAAITQESGAGVAALLVTSLAMGAMNSVFQRSGEVQVGLTYITGTVVKAGQRLVDAFFGGPRWVWLRYITLWAGLTVGAVLGAATYHRIGLDALWVGLVLLVVSTVSTWVARRVSSPVSNSD